MPDGSVTETSEFVYRLTFVLTAHEWPLTVQVESAEYGEGIIDRLVQDKPVQFRSAGRRLYVVWPRSALYAYLDVIKVPKEKPDGA